jgi:ATP-binding cassette subfamily B protein
VNGLSANSARRSIVEQTGGVRLLLQSLRAQRRGVLLGIAAGVAWTATKLAVPVFLRRGIDLGIRAGDASELRRAVEFILVIALAGSVAAGLRRYFATSVAARLETGLRARLFSHLLQQDLGFHARSPAGQLVSRAASDLQQIQQPLVNVPVTVSNALMLVGSAAALCSIDARLAAVALAPTLAILGVARRLILLQGPSARALRQALRELAGAIEEAVSGIRAIRGLGLERVEQRRVRARAADAYAEAMRMNRVRASLLPILDLLPVLGLVAVLWFGGQRVAAGQLTVGRLVQFNYYVILLVVPLRQTGITLAQLQRALVSADSVASLLARAATIVDPPFVHTATPESPTAPAGDIRFEAVDFDYEDETAVFRGLDLHIRAGETVALAGATASGKSTVLALLARFHDVTRGRILLDGVDLRHLALRDLRARVGMVFEDPFLFSGSIRDNIAFAAPDASQEDVETAARAAGAHDFITGLENGYQSPVGERGLALSGGQRQRVALARALLTHPRVFLLDQATSAVDAAKEGEIHATLRSAMRGCTTVLVGHRPATLQRVDRVLLLDGGCLADSGTHAELLARSAAYRRLLAPPGQDETADEGPQELRPPAPARTAAPDLE